MHWKKVGIVGIGLLGGSLGLALRQRKLADNVAGFVRRAATIAEAEQLQAVHSASVDLRATVDSAELIVLCTPIAQMKPLVAQMLPFLQPGAIVTDVGSVKGSVVRDLEKLVSTGGGHFVGSHPMAGAEKMGVGAARADLFVNAACVVTPSENSRSAAVRQVESLWKSVGARVLRLSPQDHDQLVSRSSHLPHVVAAQLANLILNPASPKAQSELCANGFRDTTRIASGSPEMWRDIALANRKNLARALDGFVTELKGFRRALAAGNVRAISAFFERAKARRDRWVANNDKGSSPE